MSADAATPWRSSDLVTGFMFSGSDLKRTRVLGFAQMCTSVTSDIYATYIAPQAPEVPHKHGKEGAKGRPQLLARERDSEATTASCEGKGDVLGKRRDNRRRPDSLNQTETVSSCHREEGNWTDNSV